MTRSTSVYVHFPWCLKKCPYCDFATRRTERSAVPHEPYADAVLRELEAWAPDLDGRPLESVFFGGGTPSLWEPKALGRVLRGVLSAFESRAPDVEITVECNPSSLDPARVEALRGEGVNRLSIGVQSLDDDHLRFLGRLHDSAGALRALEEAVGRVPRLSADLMFGMPGQTAARLTRAIDQLVERGVRHVSAYALTIEPGTLHRKGRLPIAPEEAYAAMFVATEERFAAHGLHHYEVSNYAIPGEESRHNLHYWRGGDYLGLGAAAVGCLTRGTGEAERVRNEPEGERYLAGRGPCERETLGPPELLREALMLGLRTEEGVDVAQAERRAGRPLIEDRRPAVERRAARGDLVVTDTRWYVPRERWLHLDGIIADLF